MTGAELHLRLCRACGIEAVYGSKRRIAARLGVDYVAYRNYTVPSSGEIGTKALVELAGRAGLRVVIDPPGETVGELRIRSKPFD